MLSKRLNSLVKYVTKSDKIIDIGCDHALLDIFLVENKYVSKMIVSDIHLEALKAGHNNIKKANLEKKIDARLGDGLGVLGTGDEINTILISGMGANTIINILNNPILEKIDKLIIQSNNNHEELRKEIVTKGFYIDAEEYFTDRQKNYINIVFKRGKKRYTSDELRYGPILIKDIDYLTFEINKCLKLKKIIPYMKLRYRFYLNYEIRKLNKYIKRVK